MFLYKHMTFARLLLGGVLVLTLGTSDIHAQGTAFTYQGRLTGGAGAVNGRYDLQFGLFGTVNGADQVGVGQVVNGVGVSNGLFTVSLDFGNPFSGANRWMEIGVRTNGAVAFTTLSPRQPLTPTPYAMYAPSAGSAASAGTATFASTAGGVTAGAVTQLGSPGGGVTNALQVSGSGWVGIGTNTPQGGLQISTGPTVYQPNLQFQVQNGNLGYSNLGGAWDIAVSTNHVLAVAAVSGGVTLMDISNPQYPVLTAQLGDSDAGSVFTNLAGANGPAFNGSILAVAAYTDSAVTIMSVTNPAAPVKLAELRDGVGAFTLLGGAYDVAFSGNNIMAVSAYNDAAVTLVNMSNPGAPTLAGYIQNGFNGFTNFLGPRHLAFFRNLLAVAANDSSAVNLIDVSNPADPQLRSVIRNGVNGFTNLSLGNGGVAFSTNGLLAIAAQGSDAVNLMDVSNPASPQLRAVINSGMGGVSRVAFSGNLLAAMATYENVVTLVDVSNPSLPQVKGRFVNGLAGLRMLNSPIGVAFDGGTLVVGAYFPGGVTLLKPLPVPVNLVANDLVGIGTAMPEAPLHVVGNMIVQGDRVSLRAGGVELGVDTVASGLDSIAMGVATTASGSFSTAMGRSTIAANDDATAMGLGSMASGWDSVAMGTYTKASGHYSMAAGYYSQATNQGSFVWADSLTTNPFRSTADNQFLIRATGGVGINTNAPRSALHVNGTVTATGFSGSGAGLTALDGAQLTAGTVPDLRLSANVALRNGNQTFTGTNTFLDGNGGGILRIGPNQTGPTPKLIKFGDGDYVSIGESGIDDRMEIRAALISLFGTIGFTHSLYVTGAVSVAGGVYAGSVGATGPISAGGSATIARNLRVDSDGGNYGEGIVLNCPPEMGGYGGLVFHSTVRGGALGADTVKWDVSYNYAPELGVTGDGLAFIRNNTSTPLYLAANGCVGVGNVTPTSRFMVVNARCDGNTWVNSSDRNLKENFGAVDSAGVLEKVVAMPVQSWNYKAQPGEQHIGPVAQDFRAAFGLGRDETSIATVDEGGVALAAIQGLNRKVEEREAALRAENAELRRSVAELKALVNTLSAEVRNGAK